VLLCGMYGEGLVKCSQCSVCTSVFPVSVLFQVQYVVCLEVAVESVVE
jgi:hypothetical protein